MHISFIILCAAPVKCLSAIDINSYICLFKQTKLHTHLRIFNVLVGVITHEQIWFATLSDFIIKNLKFQFFWTTCLFRERFFSFNSYIDYSYVCYWQLSRRTHKTVKSDL